MQAMWHILKDRPRLKGNVIILPEANAKIT